jgi:hypothetical protein
MKKTLALAVVCGVLVAPLRADVKVSSTVSMKVLGMSGTGPAITSVKGNKMRTETTFKDETVVSIIDLDAQKMIQLNVKKKEAEVYDLAQLRQEMQKTVETSEIQASFKPNGQKKTVMGKSCDGYDLSISMPTGAEGMKMEMVMGGPVWVAKGVPGFQDYAAFYKTAADKGMFFQNPQQAKAQPAQAKGFAEMYKQIAAVGMALEMDVAITMKGSGPLAGMMAKMGNATLNHVVTEVSDAPLGDDLFAVPAGFKVKNK